MTPGRQRMRMRSRFAAPLVVGIAKGASPAALLGPPESSIALGMFWLLTAINLLNYLDRFIFVAVAPVLRTSLGLNETQVGLTASSFLLIYTLTALPMGLWADRGSRTKLIAFGVILWSLATWYTAIAQTFAQLFIGRALLGIGEASYVPAGLALLGAYFAPERRARVMSGWGAGTLVGTALGFLVGGFIAQHFGWRWAFVFCGPPGLILGWLAWRAPDRAAYDASELVPEAAQALRKPSGLGALREQIRSSLSNPVVRISIIVQALGLFFTTPAIIFIPIYLHDHFHLKVGMTAVLAGGLLIPGGVVGTLLGGWLADRLTRRYAGGRMVAVCLGFAGAAPLFLAALLTHRLMLMLPLAFLGTICINIYNGPLNAVVQDVIPAHLRASAAAIILTCAHLAGDVGSPTLIGRIADHMHRWGTAGSLIALGIPALIIGAIVSLWGVRVYTRELAGREPGDDGPQVALAPA